MGNHYVPQKYLRGFTVPTCPQGLWQFDKKTLLYSEEPASIRNIAQHRAFYDADTERLLHEVVELPGNRVLDKLRSGDILLEDEERAHLSVYMATMLNRVPQQRIRGRAVALDALSAIISELREQICAYAQDGGLPAELAAKRLAEKDVVAAKFASEFPDNVRKQIQSPWPSCTVMRMFYEMPWRFVLGDGDEHFIVSDNPLFFFECYGLGTEWSEFTFPISCDLAIFGSWTPIVNGRRIFRGSQYIRESNRRLISDATRFIYSTSKFDWIRKVAKKHPPYLSRIKW